MSEPTTPVEDLPARLAEAEARAEFAEGELSALRAHCARWESEKARADKAGAELAGARDIAGWVEAERDALKAAIEKARVHAPRLVYEIDADGRHVGAPVAICCEGCTDPDLLADLERGELTEDVPAWPCPPFDAALAVPESNEDAPTGSWLEDIAKAGPAIWAAKHETTPDALTEETDG